MSTIYHSMTGTHARWAVLWRKSKEPYEWVVKEFEHDFPGAVQLYSKVLQAKKKGATLLCRNVGFPSPHSTKKMLLINEKGILWCPYCCQLRRFRLKSGYFIDDIFFPSANTQCPVCGITTDNHNVRKYNPSLNHNPYQEESSTNGSRGSTTRSTRVRGTSKLTDEQRAAKRERARKRRLARQGR